MLSKVKNFSKKYNLVVLCLVVAIIWSLFAILTDGGFLSSRNLSNLFRQMSIVGILAIGMTFVIITGNVDLSVGSILGLLGAVSALLLSASFPLPLVIFITLGLGATIGAFNGWCYAYQGVPAFIVTLAGLLIYRGIVLFITKGQTIPIDNDLFNAIGNGAFSELVGYIILATLLMLFLAIRCYRYLCAKIKLPLMPFIVNLALVSSIAIFFMFLFNSYRGLPYPIAILLVMLFIAYFISQKTTYGRTVYAIGGNAEAARYAGINIKKISLLVFASNGFIVAFASLINTARLASAVPSTGVNSELDAIAACVIGGISLAGGKGSVLGAFLGALIIASINNGMSYIGLDSAWQNTIKGLVLLLAVWLDSLSRKS